ncbi:hypothetical protein OROHE_005996 [Orobanche hederae]
MCPKMDMPPIHNHRQLAALSSNFHTRLAAGEWFTTRVSACGLFHIAYLSAPDMLKSELRSIYNQLCQDDMPMVIRAAATKLGKFAATVEAAHLKTDIMSMLEVLTQDVDSVRLLAVEACAALGKLLEPQDCVAHILPVIVNFSQDKSWHVRYMVANQLYEFCEDVGPEHTRGIAVSFNLKHFMLLEFLRETGFLVSLLQYLTTLYESIKDHLREVTITALHIDISQI